MGISDGLERLMAGRYIAGPTIEDAVERCRRLNSWRVRCVLNYLGEEIRSEEKVEAAVAVYKGMIDTIAKKKLMADISIKPTEIGLLVGFDDAKKHYSEVVEYAAKKRVFVWMDMEEGWFVDRSVELYLTKVRRRNTGICIQSYLRRSAADLVKLAKHGATVRLVKGAYSDNVEFAFKNREDTTWNFYELMDYLFKHFKRFTIATHDTHIIRKGIDLNKVYKRDVTYAMLLGIRSGYIRRLGEEGLKVAVYMPFGRAWVRYAYRRLKEAGNLRLVLSSLFG